MKETISGKIFYRPCNSGDQGATKKTFFTLTLDDIAPMKVSTQDVLEICSKIQSSVPPGLEYEMEALARLS